MIRFIDPKVACQTKKEAELLLRCGVEKGLGKCLLWVVIALCPEVRGDSLGGKRSLTELGFCQGDPVSLFSRKFRRVIVSRRDI